MFSWTKTQQTGAFALIIVLLLAFLTSGPNTSASMSAPTPGSTPPATDAHNVELVGHVGGEMRTVFVHGDRAYVGEGPKLTILDVSDPTAPAVLGSSAPWLVSVSNVYVAESDPPGHTYAYVSAEGLRVLDVTDPAAPAEVGFYAEGEPVQAIVGTTAYAGSEGRLQVLDVSDPTKPTEIGDYDVNTGCNRGSVTAVGDRAYIASCQGLWVLDVSEPTEPQQIGFCGGMSMAVDVAIASDGAYAYVADYGAGVWVVDLSDPAQPSVVGHVYFWFAWDLAVDGDRVYVGQEGGDGFWVADVSDPADPFWVGNYDYVSVLSVAVVADDPPGQTYAYLATGREGLRILDVSDVGTLEEVSFLDAEWAGDGEVAVAASDPPGQTYAYVAVEGDGLRIVDVSDPANPTPAGAYVPPDTTVDDVVVSGAYAYATVYADQHQSLQVVDVSNPNDPLPAGSYVPLGPGGVYEWIDDVAVTAADPPGQAYAYVATGSELRVVDVSDPDHPSEVYNYTESRDVEAVALAGDYVYLTGGWTMDVLDISNPAAPVRVGSLEPSWRGWYIAVSDPYVYVSSANDSLSIIDVSDPSNPIEVGLVGGFGGPLAASGDLVYFAPFSSDLVVLDVSDPTAPVLVYFDSDWNASDVAVAGGYAYVSTPSWYGGLGVLDVFDAGAPHEIASYNPPAQSHDVDVAASDPPGGQAYAYVADGWNGMQVIDVSDPAAPTWAATYYDEELGGKALAVTASEDVAYLGTQGNLHLVDVENPAAPTKIGLFGGGASDVVVSDDRAYVADTDGLRIADVSDPAAPVELGFYQLYPMLASLPSVALAGPLACLGGGDLWVLDVSDPTDPTKVGGDDLDVSDLGTSSRQGIVYAAADGLAVIKVSGVTSPTLLSTFGPYLNAWDITVMAGGDYAYVTSESDQMVIVDISDPNDPQPIGRYKGAELVREVVVVADDSPDSGYAYAAAGEEGAENLQVWNISNPAAPVPVGSYAPSWAVRQVTVTASDPPGQTYAYLVQWPDTLVIVDVSNPAAPIEVGSYQLSDLGSADSISDVAVFGNYAYIAMSNSLRVVDVSNPAAPAEIGTYSKGGQIVTVSGSTVYLGSWDGLRLLDVSDPATPVLLGFYTEPDGSVEDVVLDGSLAYLGVGEPYGTTIGGLRVVDVADPSSPTLLGAYETPALSSYRATLGLAVLDGPAGHTYAYLAAEEAGLRVVDVSDPAAPAETGFYVASGGAVSVRGSGDLVYVGDDNGGLRVVDVSDLDAPRQVGYYHLPASVDGLAATCEYVYVAAGGKGLYVLRYTEAACHTISGRATDVQGQPIAGVQIAAAPSHRTTTGADGQYTFPDLSPGTYTLAPSKPGYFWSPETRTVMVPPDATGQDFTGRHILKESSVPRHYPLSYGDAVTYTVSLVYPDDHDVVLYDPVPTYTTYLSGSLHAPAGVVYDPAAEAITGSLHLTALVPATVTFAVRVEVTGTGDFAPLIVNQACVQSQDGGLAECDAVSNQTYVRLVYLPLVQR